MAINLWYDYVSSNQIVNNLISKDLRNEYLLDSTRRSGNNFLRYNAELPDFLKNAGIPFSLNFSQAIPYLKDYNWNETQYLPIEFNFFKSAEPRDLNFVDSFFLKNGKSNTEFFVWFPHEAPDKVSTEYFELLNKNYPHIPIRFAHGNLRTPKWIADQDFINYRAFDYFWWVQQQFPRTVLDKNKEEVHTFTFYNHRSRSFRAIPYYSLLTANKLAGAKATYHGYSDNIENSTDIVNYSIQREQGEIPSEYLKFTQDVKFLDWLNLNSSNSFNFQHFDFVDLSLHSDSYLDFSTETYPFEKDDHFFVTEKTYRPIASGCIFLTLSQPGMLKYLKSKGIQTFDDLFDESYDTTSHWYNRWKIIEKNIDIWLSLGKEGRKDYYKKSFDKLVHNQNVFYSRDFAEEIRKLFQ